MKQYELVQQTNNNSFSNNWRNKQVVADEYEQYPSKFLYILAELANICDLHLYCITAAKQWTERTDGDILLVHSAPYTAGQAARKFMAPEIRRMASKGIIEPEGTKW